MDNKIIAIGAFYGMTAVILGAFGAHALKQTLSPEQLLTFDTGVRYQMYHALLLLFVGGYGGFSARTKKWALYCIGSGIVLFSGSIYLLSTGAIVGVNKIIGPLTPVGGLLLIIGWISLIIDYFRKKS